jgi:hypothetical protein
MEILPEGRPCIDLAEAPKAVHAYRVSTPTLAYFHSTSRARCYQGETHARVQRSGLCSIPRPRRMCPRSW